MKKIAYVIVLILAGTFGLLLSRYVNGPVNWGAYDHPWLAEPLE